MVCCVRSTDIKGSCSIDRSQDFNDSAGPPGNPKGTKDLVTSRPFNEPSIGSASATSFASSGPTTVAAAVTSLGFMVALQIPRDVRRRRVIDACSFCGRKEGEAGQLVVGRSALICRDCAAQVNQLFSPGSS
jgi:ClpX C4-type zinc finger